jgi:hypothetical protein
MQSSDASLHVEEALQEQLNLGSRPATAAIWCIADVLGRQACPEVGRSLECRNISASGSGEQQEGMQEGECRMTG